MPIVVNMRWPGATVAQYEVLRPIVKWETDSPAGLVYHVAAFDDDGAYVTDVWDSAEHFDAFVRTRLMPSTKQVGVQGEPMVEIRSVHTVFAPGYSVSMPEHTAGARRG